MKHLFIFLLCFGSIAASQAQQTKTSTSLERDLKTTMQSLSSDHQLHAADGKIITYNITILNASVNLTSCLLTWREHLFIGDGTQDRTNSLNLRDIATINTIPSSKTKLHVDPELQIVQIKMIPDAATSQVSASFNPDGSDYKPAEILHPSTFHIYAPTAAQAADLSAKLLQITLTACRPPSTPLAPAN